MSEYESLRVERREHIAEVMLIGPGKGNAMGPAMFRELRSAFEELDRADDVRAVVLRGGGDNFCYGLDLSAILPLLGPYIMAPGGAAERTKLLDLLEGLQAGVAAVGRCRKPVVAAIHGWCIGGGLDLAATCDVRLCSADARFSLREVKLGIVADLGSLQRLPRIIGEARTRELAYTGRNFDAREAERIGLVSAIHETPAALFAAAEALAVEIAANPPLAVQGAKRILEWAGAADIAEGLRRLAVWNAAFLQSEDLGEAFAAFAEKRPPAFKGR